MSSDSSMQARLFARYGRAPVTSTAPEGERMVEELALQASGLGLWVLDLVAREFRPSGRFCQILGHEPLEAIEAAEWSDLFAFVHTDDMATLFEELDSHLAGMWPLDIELRLRARHANFRWYRLAGCAHWDGENKPVLVAGTLEDVNERREANDEIRRSEARLRQLTDDMHESEERFRQLAEHMEDMFWLEDTATGAAIYVNPALSRVLPVDPDEFVKAPRECWARIAHPADRELAATLGALSEDAKTDATFRLGIGKDRQRWIHARTFPILDGDGQLYRIAGIAQDVTEAKLAQDTLRDSQKMESIGQLAAGVAHEINTPIQYVGDNLHFLKESFEALAAVIERVKALVAESKGATPSSDALSALAEDLKARDVEFLIEELPMAIDQALDGTGQVARIVRAMKEFSHPGSPDVPVPLDVNRTIESATTVCRNEWKYVADLVLELAPDLPFVPSFPGSLGQVVVNMVVNAAHAIGDVVGNTGAKGSITVRTSVVEGSVEIAIIDTGAGIPEAIRHRVFEPFFTSKAVGKGTGQGLSLAWASIVERHKGSLRLESAIGVGTTFVICMPLAAPQSGELSDEEMAA